ncbi:3-dehydroquinate dehydratase [Nonomuraea polychroma]|uniref:3-dehydroquinate dehydratase n=1 Tax=Nonomuraea polychroma TaxID=46176 RepID=A0A438M6Y8_9ACTN|nr:type II 3-dehydroquinate dehydratase [Nonomuraea polychroma]RVX41479.1 3-dehydroquinate dehydratase [Nonomuraea polychroma]
MSTVLALNGPNLDLLGRREPHLYGAATLADVEALCRDTAAGCGPQVDCRQSNHDADVVICGAGAHGCALALKHLSHLLEREQ